MSCERMHLPLIFTGRYGYFATPNLVSFAFGISSQSPALTSQLENGLVEIRNTVIGMFNQWHQSFTEDRSVPVQLRFLLAAAAESNVRDYVSQLAVFSSPHFSEAAFTKRLLKCLVDTINLKTGDGEMKRLAMLCFCVLCAIDGELITMPVIRNDACPRS